ncbi:MAG: hypothetical protein KGL53_01785, partial [Elusimicrobia bacterium]|nr:hypothetical protein [Elusimicrobiota bacterium]
TVSRDEATGEVRLDVQSSLGPAGGPARESQALVVLDASGTVTRREVSPRAAACLARRARP